MLQWTAEDFVTLSTKRGAFTPYIRRMDGILPQHNVLLGIWGSVILDCGQAITKRRVRKGERALKATEIIHTLTEICKVKQAKHGQNKQKRQYNFQNTYTLKA